MPSKQPSRATALPVLVVMGVSGSGKTDTSHAVADALGLPHIEADNFHPAENVARMRAGTPLSDTDRVQWLHALIGEMQRTLDSGSGFVLACSALKARYRERLRERAETDYSNETR